MKPRGSAAAVKDEPTPGSHKRTRATVPPLSREQIVQAIKEAGGVVGGSSGAAARLGLKRTTLLAHMKRLAIDPRTVIDTYDSVTAPVTS